MTAPRGELEVRLLGRQSFDHVTNTLQRELLEQRIRGEIPDVLLMFEPIEDVYAAGTGSKRALREELVKKEVEIVEVDRGGSITYHGPGQIIGYFVADSKARGLGDRNIVDFVKLIEQGLLYTSKQFGAEKAYVHESPIYDPRPHRKAMVRQMGIWVGGGEGQENKLAAIGMRFAQGRYTQHGFALNVNTDLDMFLNIYPCGFKDKGVTSLTQETGRPILPGEVYDHLARSLKRSMGYEKLTMLREGNF